MNITYQGGHQLDSEIRTTAIKRYLGGEKPESIYSDLNRSKKWFFKWLKRYQSGDKDWYKDQPKAPKNSPTRISETDKKRIIETRKRLKAERFAQTGASAIKWELSKSGFDFPSDRTKNSLHSKRGRISLFHRGPGF
jgi:putative transposase